MDILVLDNTPQAVAERAARARDILRSAMEPVHNARIQKCWPEWEARFTQIIETCRVPPAVEIALVGRTGSGKSSLVNALLGARILPVSNMRACTSAVTEIAHADSPAFEARIEFISRDAWKHEVGLLLADLSDAQRNIARSARPQADGESAPGFEVPRAARDKLWTVYRPEGSDDPGSFNSRQLDEPDEIRSALDTGEHVIVSADLDDFRKQLSKYLDARQRFWPLVKRVRIQGPIPALRGGVKLVDLPGMDDPNEAREEVTKTHLKSCRFVWMVFNIKRVLTKDAFHLMQSDDFLRQVVMDGRAGSLTFVGTSSDDVDPESAREELGLAGDASQMEIVLARNAAVKKEVTRQLEDLSFHMARNAGESAHRATALAELFKRSLIYTVSAREAMRLGGHARSPSAGFDSAEQTEIPALREHMEETSFRFGAEAQSIAQHRQIDLLLTEIRQQLKVQHVRVDKLSEIGTETAQSQEAAADAARTFLGERLEPLRERFDRDLEKHQSNLSERLKSAVAIGGAELDAVLKAWSQLPWNTLRASMRRKGVHQGADRTRDFCNDMSKPILDTIAFAWCDFFGDALGSIVQTSADTLNETLQEHGRLLLRSSSGLDAAMRQELAASLETQGTVLKECLDAIRSNMRKRSDALRCSLYEELPKQIRAGMTPGFEDAGKENGEGMQERMIKSLEHHARAVAGILYLTAETSMRDGIRELCDWLGGEFARMIAETRRQAERAADNFKAQRPLSAAAMESERSELRGVMDVVQDLCSSSKRRAVVAA